MPAARRLASALGIDLTTLSGTGQDGVITVRDVERAAESVKRGTMSTAAPSGVRSRWRDDEAAACANELELRAYTSRLLGQDPSLVLHGGGNTSVKLTETNIFGEAEDILWVKGSGWDLANIEPAGFAPVRMRQLLALSKLTALSDTDMARELRVGTVDPAAPSPSVEAILHAIVPVQVRRPHARGRGAHAHQLGEWSRR